MKGKGQGWASSKTRKLQRTIAVIEIGNALLSMYLMFLTAAVNVDEIVVSVIVCVLQISMALDCARDSHPVAGHCHDRNNQPALTGIPHRDGRSSTLCPTVGTSRGTITGVVAARKALQGDRAWCRSSERLWWALARADTKPERTRGVVTTTGVKLRSSRPHVVLSNGRRPVQ